MTRREICVKGIRQTRYHMRVKEESREDINDCLSSYQPQNVKTTVISLTPPCNLQNTHTHRICKHTHSHKKTDMQADRQAEKGLNIQAHIQTDRHYKIHLPGSTSQPLFASHLLVIQTHEGATIQFQVWSSLSPCLGISQLGVFSCSLLCLYDGCV